MKYIGILRLERASRMLAEEEMSVGGIASECGFADVGYFCRCFKKNYGLTPTEYAEKHRS